jgi:hypothetical protein
VSILFVHSHYGMTEPLFSRAAAEGKVDLVRERDLTDTHFAGATGLVTTTHLDQIGFLRHTGSVQALLDRGGRWVFNGHVLRPLVAGLANYVPLAKPRRTDYALTRLFEHPVFAGIDQKALEENMGVAGFYGRGHNPLPPGAIAVNGLGPDRLPIDWDWALPSGGRILCHAGNEFWGSGDGEATRQLLADRTVAWVSKDLS